MSSSPPSGGLWKSGLDCSEPARFATHDGALRAALDSPVTLRIDPTEGETSNVSSVGVLLKAARLAANLSQRKLAALAGVSFPHISKIEAGHEVPSEDLLLRLADLLDVPADDLLLAADRLPEDVSQAVLAKRGLAPEFLRSWQSGDITDEQVKELLKRARGDR